MSSSRARVPRLLMLAVLLPVPVLAQVFTLVDDPSNPIVADRMESVGSSWIDLDADGDLDLFVANGNTASQNNALYVNLGGLQFRKVLTGPVVNDGGTSIGGCWGDYDADGKADLFVTNRFAFGNFLYHGESDTVFQRVTGIAPDTDRANSNSTSWIDIDRDNDLDLYVVNFQGDDFLYINQGPPNWSWQRVVIPELTAGTQFSIHGAWADFDDDGDQDLFVGHAGNQHDVLYVNGGGLSFTQRTILDGRSTLGGSWGDYDNDGRLDFFAANYLGQAGILYHNDGPPGFELNAQPPGVLLAIPGDAVGSAWGDIDNDGDLDLLVAHDNGQNEALYLNNGPPNYTFTRITTGPLVSGGKNSFGCSFADMDGDGDLDAFVANRSNAGNGLYRNDGPAGSWLELRLHGVISNRTAIGTRVLVWARIGGTTRLQRRDVLPLSGYNSQNLDLHFGLNDASHADSIEIQWPSGIRQQLLAIPAGQRLDVVEPTTTPVTASLLRARATSQGVEIEWELGEATPQLSLDRCAESGVWRALDALVVSGRRAIVSDRDVQPGQRYGYRLVIRSDVEQLGPEVWIAAWAPGDFEVRLASGSPTRSAAVVSLSLPRAGDIRIDVVDVRGRLRTTRHLSGLPSGVHLISIPKDRSYEAGVYWLRTQFAATTRTTRIVFLP